LNIKNMKHHCLSLLSLKKGGWDLSHYKISI
jgi:hypothetical protein